VKYILLILFNVLVSGSGDVHDFHLSKTDIHYKTEQKAVQLTIHTFIDDTEAVLKDQEDIEYKFFESTEHALTDSIFNDYLNKNITITIDGEQQAFYYLGKEQSDDILGVYAYLEIEGIDSFQSIEISNSVLMDKFDDQKNIINFKVDNKSKAFHILTKKDYQKTIDL